MKYYCHTKLKSIGSNFNSEVTSVIVIINKETFNVINNLKYGFYGGDREVTNRLERFYVMLIKLNILNWLKILQLQLFLLFILFGGGGGGA